MYEKNQIYLEKDKYAYGRIIQKFGTPLLSEIKPEPKSHPCRVDLLSNLHAKMAIPE